MKNKKGISLIVLIITIIVVIILAAVVILTLSKNNPIESAKEARFKEDVRTFQDELALYISKQYANAGGQWDGDISATTHDDIVQYIPSFTKKYEGKFVINNNNLEYTNNLDEKEKEYVKSLSVREEVSKLLPDEYQQVEYIESTGAQYIDTGVIPTSTLNGEFDLISIDGGYSFGSTNGQDNDYWGMNFYKTDGTFQLYYGTGSYPFVSSWQKNIRYKISIIDKKFYCDNVLLYDFSQTSNGVDFNTNKSIYLFGLNYNGGAFSRVKFYGVKLFEKNVLIRNFIPCYRKSDNKPGLFDSVEEKFYTNKGVGEFFLPNGEKQLPLEYKQIEYIESTGTQYIDTEVIPTSTLNGEFNLMSIDGGYPFGSTNGQNIDYWGMNFYKTDGTFQLYYGTGSYPFVNSWQKNIRYKISIIDKKFYCDNVLLYDFSQTTNSVDFNTNKSIYLFGLNYNGGTFAKFKFYEAKFWDENVLIRNFIPCYSTTTVTNARGVKVQKNTKGLYDTVEGKFYTNQGTGEFIAGPDVNE